VPEAPFVTYELKARAIPDPASDEEVIELLARQFAETRMHA
jgi:hypothetical protein